MKAQISPERQSYETVELIRKLKWDNETAQSFLAAGQRIRAGRQDGRLVSICQVEAKTSARSANVASKINANHAYPKKTKGKGSDD